MAKSYRNLDYEYFRIALKAIAIDIHLYNSIELSAELSRLAKLASQASK